MTNIDDKQLRKKVEKALKPLGLSVLLVKTTRVRPTKQKEKEYYYVKTHIHPVIVRTLDLEERDVVIIVGVSKQKAEEDDAARS